MCLFFVYIYIHNILIIIFMLQNTKKMLANWELLPYLVFLPLFWCDTFTFSVQVCPITVPAKPLWVRLSYLYTIYSNTDELECAFTVKWFIYYESTSMYYLLWFKLIVPRNVFLLGSALRSKLSDNNTEITRLVQYLYLRTIQACLTISAFYNCTDCNTAIKHITVIVWI